MSKSPPPPADGDAPPASKKKGKLKPLLIYGVGGLVLIGGGAGAGLYAAGSGMAGAHGEPVKEQPKLVPKGEGHGGEAAEGGHGGAAKSEGHGEGAELGAHGAPISEAHPDPSKYEASYYPIEQPFTANLQDSDGLIQVSLGVATYYDSRVIDNLKRHEMPLRSAILMTLGNQDPNAISSPEGKRALQVALTKTINQVLRQKEGFGGIDDVYFTNFIVQ